MTDDKEVEKVEERKHKPIHGLGARFNSRYVNADITIPAGQLRRLKRWMDEHWKLAAWRSCITIIAIFPTIYGISLGNMTIADKSRLSVLEVKAENHDKLSAEQERLNTKVQSLEEKLRLKSIDFDNLSFEVAALKAENAIRRQINEEDGKMFERQAQEERDRKKRLKLEEQNKARAEKLKKIGQTEDLRANPQAPKTTIYSPTKN